MPGKGDALVARAPDSKTLLVVGPTALSARQRQNDRLCSFGETRLCEEGERVEFAFQFLKLDDANRCFEILTPWLETPRNVRNGERTSLRMMLGIPSDIPKVEGTRDSPAVDLVEGDFTATETKTTTELMSTSQVVTMMDAVTTECMVSETLVTSECVVETAQAHPADTDKTPMADIPLLKSTKEVAVDEDLQEMKSMAIDASDTDSEPEEVIEKIKTHDKEIQTAPEKIESAEKEIQTAPETLAPPWTWSAGIPTDVDDDTAKKHATSLLRCCFKPQTIIAGDAAAFASAPLGAHMPFDRYAKLVGEAMDEMVRSGEISIPGGESDTDDERIEQEGDEGDEEYF